MIRLPLLTTLLLLLALPTQAARLELADNLTLLASSRGKASPFERALTLPAGETRLLVRFDSPLDPGSTNESQGRVRPAAADPDPAGQRHPAAGHPATAHPAGHSPLCGQPGSAAGDP